MIHKQERAKQNRRFVVGLGLLISAFFLFLAFRELHPEQFLSSLQGIRPAWLAAAALIYFLAVIVIALRWQFVLRSIQLVPLARLSELVCMAYMGNNVYPLRAGEALRIYLLKRNHQIPVTKAATTVIVERVFDGLVMLSFIVVGLPFIQVNSTEIQTVASFAAPIFLTLMLLFFGLAARPDWLRKLEKFVVRWLPGRIGALVDDLSEGILHGLESLRSPAWLLGVVISSFVTWSIEALVYWLVMQALGIQAPYAVALLVVGTVNLAGILPASPGQFGVYEFFVQAAMVATGVPADTALAYAVVVHIVIWLPVTLVGFALLARQGLGWSHLSQAPEIEAGEIAAEIDPAEPAPA